MTISKFKVFYKNKISSKFNSDHKNVEIGEPIENIKDYYVIDKVPYIGIFDKDGQELFEKCIIEVDQYNPSKYEIKYIEGGFCATRPNLEGYPIDINHFTSKDIKIIGTTIENKDWWKV